MHIGFDLDKIFVDYPPFVPDVLIDRIYKKKSNDTLLYRIPKKPEQLLRYFSHHPMFRPIIKKNLTLLQKHVQKKQHTMYLISSRFNFLKKRTDKLTTKYEFTRFFDDMFFNFENKQPHVFKDEVIKKLKLDRYVDDDLPLLTFLSKNHPQTHFFWLNTKKQDKLGNNLFAIKELSDIFS